MPNFDGTGPDGFGPRNGRGMGNCAIANARSQRLGCGRGMGRGRFCCPFNRQEPVALDAQLRMLKLEQQRIQSEIDHLEKEIALND